MAAHSTLNDYYMQQARSSLPSYYIGPSHQRGHGLGGIFASLFKAAMPVLKSVAPVLKRGAKAVAREAITTGAQVATDALAGEDWKKSAAKHSNLVARRLVKKGAQNLSSMLNERNITTKRKGGKAKSIKATKTRKIKSRDVFD